MKKTTVQVVYRPRTPVPVSPELKAVLVDAEKFVLDNHKVYTYAIGDFIGDANVTKTIYAHPEIKVTDGDSITLSAKVKANDEYVNLVADSDAGQYVVSDGKIDLKKMALGKRIMPTTGTAFPVTVNNGIITDGMPINAKRVNHYMIANGKLAVHPIAPTGLSGWSVSAADGIYSIYLYEDVFNLYTGTPRPVNVYISVNRETVNTDNHAKLIEIDNIDKIIDMYGEYAIKSKGNIAYSAYRFMMESGATKSFYIAPMAQSTDISDLISELSATSDAYYLVYNTGPYSTNKANIDALVAHARVMSSPLYKKERRLYIKEQISGNTGSDIIATKNVAINGALSLDNERVSMIAEVVNTDSLVLYCAKRYMYERGYSLTHEPINIGSIWNTIMYLNDSDLEEMKDNGVVMFEQPTPSSIPKVMYQTTTYISHDNIYKKEEDIQVAIDELCRSIRTMYDPLIARGLDNKVTGDPNSAASQSYIKRLNAGIHPLRALYADVFTSIDVVAIEIDEYDPRHSRLRLSVVPYNTVNRIDLTIYVV